MWNCISRIPYPGNWWFLFGYASHGPMQSGWGLGYVRAPVCWTAMNFGSTCDWGEHGHATKCPHHRAGDGFGHVVARLMKVKDCFGGAMNISEPLWPWRCLGFFVQVIKLRQINESQMIKFVTQDGECIPRPGVFEPTKPWGFMIQFGLRIVFFKWVAQPPRNEDLLTSSFFVNFQTQPTDRHFGCQKLPWC